jgi:opacity protein-like surface antigen
MKYRSSFLLVLFFAVSGPALAQDATIFGGFQHPGALTLGSSVEGAVDVAGSITDPKDFGVFGLRVYTSEAPVGLETTLAYSPNFISSEGNAFISNVNLRAELPAPVIRPYATAGIGLVRAGGEPPVDFGTKFALNVGGGIKLAVLPRVGLRFDVRGYSIRGVQDQSLEVFESSIGIFISY